MERLKTSARDQFDSWSRSYDQSILQRMFFGPSHDLVLKMVRLPADARVLDVGCGTGLFARRLLAGHPTASLVGLDLSEQMLAKARANCYAVRDRISLVAGDSERLPFRDDSFDLITCIHSFHHYPNQKQVVEEMYRALKPMGQLILVDGNRDGWWGWLVFDLVVTTLEGGVHHCSARRFRQIFNAVGFSEVAQVAAGRTAPLLITVGTAAKQAGQHAEAA